MRVRKLDENGDMVLGGGQQSLYRDQPEAVAQIVMTRLLLTVGTWFLDITDGTDWQNSVLGRGTEKSRDVELSSRILTTPGVKELIAFSSSFDPVTRRYTVAATIDTIYGQTTVQGTF